MSIIAAAIIGIATMADGKRCVSFEGKVLEPQRVTIVSSDDTSRRTTARLGAAVESCGALESAQIGGTHYELETASDFDSPSFAIIGDASKLRFRACTSYEGMHLFVHCGKKRLFHGYYFFAYDVEPTCRDEDFP